MKKKLLLYVSSIMCLSLSVIQISNAMQSDKDSSMKEVHFIYTTPRNDKLRIAFKVNHGEVEPSLLKFKIQNPHNGKIEHYLIIQQPGGSGKGQNVNIFAVTEDVYNRTNALLADATVQPNG